MTTLIRHRCGTPDCDGVLELGATGHLSSGWIAATCPVCGGGFALRKGELVRISEAGEPD